LYFAIMIVSVRAVVGIRIRERRRRVEGRRIMVEVGERRIMVEETC
jgi:hypothetical protein